MNSPFAVRNPIIAYKLIKEYKEEDQSDFSV